MRGSQIPPKYCPTLKYDCPGFPELKMFFKISFRTMLVYTNLQTDNLYLAPYLMAIKIIMFIHVGLTVN